LRGAAAELLKGTDMQRYRLKPGFRRGTRRQAGEFSDPQNKRSYTVDGLVDDVIETLVTNCDTESQAQEESLEAVDQAVPVYYSGQLAVLDNSWNDVAFQDTSEMGSSYSEISKLLPAAIYMAIDEGLHNRWDEVVEGIAAKRGEPVEDENQDY